MKNIFSRSLIAIALTTCMTVSYADTASSSQDATFTAQQKQAIEKVIHNYLVENPEVLIEASQALQKKQAASEKKNALVAIKANLMTCFMMRIHLLQVILMVISTWWSFMTINVAIVSKCLRCLMS